MLSEVNEVLRGSQILRIVKGKKKKNSGKIMRSARCTEAQ